MAFFNDLVRVIAAAEGMDEMTVSGIGQYARDAGHISKGGRGRSAARMTHRDAANLLMAVNGTDLAKNAGEAVSSFGGMTRWPLDAVPFRKEQPQALEEMVAKTTFGEALENLIRVVTVDAIGAFDLAFALHSELPDVTADLDKLMTDAARSFRVEVGFRRPNRMAFISVVRKGPPPVTNPFQRHAHDQVFLAIYGSDRAGTSSDREDQTIITGRTLREVGALIAT